MPAIRKPLSSITTQDLEGLVADGWAEDELLEFKETLPGRGAARDRWFIDQSEVGTAAKRDVLAEVVGMANSYGGDVVLGMKESDSLPHRAKGLIPLPKCHDLARRFEMFARDHIRPEIPLLAVRGIPNADGSGIVVIRVPRSAQAPHRLEITGTVKECYKRVQDRTEVMSMREIQDLTLDTARGLERVNSVLAALREAFADFCKHQSLKTFSHSAVSFCVRAAPVGAVPAIMRVHGVSELIPTLHDRTIEFANGQKISCAEAGYGGNWRPMLRGTRLQSVDEEWRFLVQLTSDGAFLACTSWNTENMTDDHRALRPEWIFAPILNACTSIDRFRAYSGGDAIEYALEIEVIAHTVPHRVMAFGARSPHGYSPAALHGRLGLPRYSLGPPSERVQLIGQVYEDFWSALGIDAHMERITAVD